jgi:uncharacterized membrane protein
MSACALAAFGHLAGVIPADALVPVIAGATIGSFVESLLATMFEGAGVLNNDALNLINTAAAAFAAIAVAGASA